MAEGMLLEDLIVRLTGDGSLYQKMLEQAANATKLASSTIETATKTFDQFKGTLQSAATAVTSYIASWNAFSRLEGIFNKFVEHEGVELKLKAAIEANDHAVSSLFPKYKLFAAHMSEVTVASKDQVLSLLQQAENFGITGAAAERAAKNVLAAQAAGLPASMRMMTMLEQGQTMMLNRVLPGIRAIKDPVEKAAYAQERLAKMFKTAEAEAATLGGQLKQLQNAYSSLQKELGETVAIAIRPIVEWTKQAVTWFRSLSPAIKETVVVLAGVAAGVIFLTGTIATLGVVWNLAGGGMITALGLVAVALMGAGAGVAFLVQDLGGVAKATEYIKEAAVKAWEWIKPVRQALESLWNQILVSGRSVWEAVKKYAIDTWARILGSTTVTWDQIRDTVRDAILFIEFTLTHFGQVSEFVWTASKLGAVMLWEEIKYIFKQGLPAIGGWLEENWGTIMHGIYDAMVKYMQLGLDSWALIWKNIDWNVLWAGFDAAAKTHVGNLVTSIGLAAAGGIKTKDFESIWESIWGIPDKSRGNTVEQLKKDLDDLGRSVRISFGKLTELKLPTREIGALEQQLRSLYETQKNAISISFAEFRRRKLEEFAAMGSEPAKKLLEESGGALGGALGKGLKKGIEREKVDFVLAGSVEAVLHVAEYQKTLEAAMDQMHASHPGAGGGRDEEGIAGGGAGIGGGRLPTPGVAPSPVSPAGTAIETTDQKLLRQILETLQAMAAKDTDKPKVASLPV